MVVAKSKTAERCKRVVFNVMTTPVGVKHLRLCASLIAIVNLLVAHLLLFLTLMGLSHIEQIKEILQVDIQDQIESGFYSLFPFRNDLRLEVASQLVSVIELVLYVLSFITSIYVLCSISLCVGIHKNRCYLMLPWLIADVVLLFAGTILIVYLQNIKFVEFIGGKAVFFGAWICAIITDLLMWIIVQNYYRRVRTMNQLREIATVAIPCPAPGAKIQFEFRRENMHLGSNGYKHILTEAPDGNY